MTDALAINLDAPCWLHQGYRSKGYGAMRANGKQVAAHRYMWTVMRGPIPEGIHIHHLCEIKLCLNPQHMTLVTPREHVFLGNTWARRHIETTHCPQGHPYDEANTYRRKTKRYCLECRRESDRRRRGAAWWREYRRRRREAGRTVR